MRTKSNIYNLNLVWEGEDTPEKNIMYDLLNYVINKLKTNNDLQF